MMSASTTSAGAPTYGWLHIVTVIVGALIALAAARAYGLNGKSPAPDASRGLQQQSLDPNDDNVTILEEVEDGLIGKSPTSAAPRIIGLQQQFPDPNNKKATISKEIDIIAIHGLGARSPDTWIAWKVDGDRNSGNVNWLKDPDMLPSKMTNARIMTYDWSADYDKDASSDIFMGHADALLDRIHGDRRKHSRLDTPIIFIASCFGGLLLAKALLRANDIYHSRSDDNQKIFNSIIGIIFLGTPFRGSWALGRRAAEERIKCARIEAMQYSVELISYLSQSTSNNQSPLDELRIRFEEMTINPTFKIPIVCFYENKGTHPSAYVPKLKVDDIPAEFLRSEYGIVVNRDSATLARADNQGLDVRHNMLHKFNNPNNDGFSRLAGKLDSFLSGSRKILRGEVLSRIAFSTMTRRCTELKQVRVVPGTADWLLDTEVFKAWESQITGKIPLPLLILEGKAGSGKSVIMYTSFKLAQSRPSKDKGIYILYCLDASNGSPLQNTYQGLYRSILHQILEQIIPSQIICQEIRSWDKNAGEYENIVLLVDRIIWVVSQTASQSINIYIDALDECVSENEDETDEIIDIVEFVKLLQKTCASIRVCLSVRDKRRFGSDLTSAHTIKIDQRNENCIRRYIEDRLELRERPELRSTVISQLLSRSSNMFQWVVIVVQRINKMTTQGLQHKEIMSEVKYLPMKLKTLYESLLIRMDPQRYNEAIIMLQLVQVALRPLKISEMISALEHAKGTDYDIDRYESMPLQEFRDRFESCCQGLLKIRITKEIPDKFPLDTTHTDQEEMLVQFTHQSVREFLEQREALGNNLPLRNVAQTHLIVARLCMRVVNLQYDDSPFLPYASSFWTAHARKGNEAINDTFEPPSFVTSCTTRKIITEWKESLRNHRSMAFLEDIKDYANTNWLRSDKKSILLLLAFEGCKELIIRHFRDCKRGSECYGDPSVLETAIYLAATRGWSDIIKEIARLAEQSLVRVNINTALPFHLLTPLFIATILGHSNAVSALLELGCDIVDKTNDEPQHPLHAAVIHGHLPIIHLLLKHADEDVEYLLKAQDFRGHTAFHMAAGLGMWPAFKEIFDALKRCTEHPSELLNIKSANSETALDLAIASKERLSGCQRAVNKSHYDNIIETLKKHCVSEFS